MADSLFELDEVPNAEAAKRAESLLLDDDDDDDDDEDLSDLSDSELSDDEPIGRTATVHD